jgi:pyruvate dehydrogenase E2 component (dihydrolipoamide acetyltransferase)
MKASPVAQRMAAEHNINLKSLSGSGPGGRIVKRDIEAILELEAGAPVAVAVPTSPPLQPAAATTAAPYEDIPMNSNRETIARRLPQSLGPIPHFYLEMDIDAEPLTNVKTQLQDLAGEVRITVTDILVKACTVALRKHPEVNSQFTGKAIRRFNSVNVGLAVAGKGTLMVPVIRSCETKSISQIAQDRAALVEKGQAGRLSIDEMTGGTFSISNLGMFGLTRFSAIINPPEASILAVGATRDEPVVKNGQIVPGKRMTLTLSCDHRVFDGAEGARFMATLKQILENPVTLCL